MKNETDD